MLKFPFQKRHSRRRLSIAQVIIFGLCSLVANKAGVLCRLIELLLNLSCWHCNSFWLCVVFAPLDVYFQLPWTRSATTIDEGTVHGVDEFIVGSCQLSIEDLLSLIARSCCDQVGGR